MSALLEIQQAVAAVAARVGPSVAGLTRGWGRGSGVVIAPGRVLTNAHVLRGAEATVSLGGADAAAGRLAGVDEDSDLAVISVDTGEAPPVAWDPDAVEELTAGTAVLALADPGGRGLRTTLGTATGGPRGFPGPGRRRGSRAIEHTAPLPRGSSGGPLVDAEGRLLGINTLRLDGGLILALAADARVKELVDALARGEVVARPRLGLALADPRFAHRLRAAVGLPARDGLLVRAVQPGSPADRAGLRRGDLLVAAEGRALAAVDDLLGALETAGSGGALVLTVVRGTDEREVRVGLQGPPAVA